MSWISLVVGLAGSVGLLMVGLRTAVEGVRVAGGSMLVGNLWRWTCDRRSSALTGLTGGALLPASGTLMETGYGLAGAGLVSTRNALWLLLGARLGGVLAGSAVLAVAFGPGLRLIALSTVSVGLVLQVTGRDERWTTWGKGLIGLGLTGVGLEVLSTALTEWAAVSTYPGLDLALPVRTALMAICGAGLAYALNSTTLATATVLLTVGAGLLNATSGLGWMLGIPVGLGLRALPTLRGDRGAARRVVVLHYTAIIVSVILGAGAIAISLPLIAAPPSILSDPMVLVAAFALLTNLTAAGVIAAIDAPLTRWLEEQWPDDEALAAERGMGLRAVPELARQALVDDVHRIAVTARNLARGILGDGGGVTDFRVREDLSAARAGLQSVEEDCSALIASAPPAEVAQVAGRLPSVARSQVRLTESLARLRAAGPAGLEALPAPARSRMRHGVLAALHLVESSDPLHARFSERQLDGELQTVEAQMRDLRQRFYALHRQGTLGDEGLEGLIEHTDRLRDIARLTAECGRTFAAALPAPVQAPGTDAEVQSALERAPTAVPLADTALRQNPERMRPADAGSGHPELRQTATSGQPSPFDPQPLDPAALDGAPAALPAGTDGYAQQQAQQAAQYAEQQQAAQYAQQQQAAQYAQQQQAAQYAQQQQAAQYAQQQQPAHYAQQQPAQTQPPLAPPPYAQAPADPPSELTASRVRPRRRG